MAIKSELRDSQDSIFAQDLLNDLKRIRQEQYAQYQQEQQLPPA